MLVAFSIIKRKPCRISLNLYNAGIATLTIYSILKGVLEIYGTTNSLIVWYLYIAVILIVVALVLEAISAKLKNSKQL